MSSPLDRRQFAINAAIAAGLSSLSTADALAISASSTSTDAKMLERPKPRYSLNTSTIQGEKIPVIEQIEIASDAGYQGIEIWLRDVDNYQQSGGTVSDLRKRIDDSGLTVEGAIAFAEWIVDDDSRRGKGLDQAKQEMELVVALGGKRIAAPPAGATSGNKLDLELAAARYRSLLDIGDAVGCLPMLEVWGFSTNLHSLAQVLHVAAATLHPNACILPDVYHLYKGGSNFEDLSFLAGSKVPMLHMNDYPDISRDKINDADRVYPGDGVAPVSRVLKHLYSTGFTGTLSLELFNRTYWQQNPREVARTGLKKMKQIVDSLV